MIKNRRRLEKRKRKDGCSGKKRYDEYDRAKNDAISLLENKKSLAHTTVYLCRLCDRYHVSSKKQRGWIVLIEREDICQEDTKATPGTTKQT